MIDLYIPHDHATAERQRWIRSVSPFHRHESFAPYMLAWILALIAGLPMPHERRQVSK